MFAKLIDPLSLDEFVSSYWDKRTLYVDGQGQRTFDDIVSAADLDDFLSRTDIRYPSLRLVQKGAEISLRDYTRELKLGPHVSDDLIDNEKMFSHFNEGATIVLQFLQHNIPRFGTFTNNLEDDFSCNIHGSCFITPPNAQGFTSHYDTYSFFVLQILGQKSWKLYPRTARKPIREDRVGDAPWTPVDPVEEHILKPGDFLYVPRGVYHAAETADSTSIHMSIGFFAPTWLDIIRAALTDLHDAPALRANPHPPSGPPDPREIAEVKQFLAEKLDLGAGLARLREDYFAKRVDTRTNRLLDIAALPQLGPASLISVQPGLAYRIRDTQGSLELEFADKKIRLPAAAGATIEYLRKKGATLAGGIVDSLSFQSRLLVLKRLIEEGFLTLHRN